MTAGIKCSFLSFSGSQSHRKSAACGWHSSLNSEPVPWVNAGRCVILSYGGWLMEERGTIMVFFFLSGESFNSLRLPQRFSPFVHLNESVLEKIIVLQIFSKHMAEYLGSNSLVSICETSWILWWIICLSAWSPRLHICSYRLLRSKLFNLQL